ncbi:nitroreductase family protein [Pseudomarimonas salicorniae]|uniref:Putative NAD(P)H nitroreductase n=1 Tax=Pseudomarimonas salicorniae TaxID=2933270 RepID=A0ABT0GLA6_9GAMM|nr:nitroreductase [Lysobacter sp. CAU 1642]MCK7595291.1 nitroreductase [Lysobacter sp. CAU 1642]
MNEPDQVPGLLERRRSTPSRLLGGPAPDIETLERVARTALRVPDHGKLQPWRILLLRGAPRQAFGEWLLARRAAQQPPPAEAVIDKERQKMTTAPVIFVVISRIGDTDRIPELEQILSGGCVCFSLLLAAEAEGLGAQWLTGWPAYDEGVAAHLGLSAGERILGFIHVGHAQEEVPERVRPEFAEHFQEWQT